MAVSMPEIKRYRVSDKIRAKVREGERTIRSRFVGYCVEAIVSTTWNPMAPGVASHLQCTECVIAILRLVRCYWKYHPPPLVPSTGANTVIFYDSDWNPAMDQQAQDRCHRIG